MPKIKNALDSIKQRRSTLEEHGSNILSHGKDIIEKGKELVNSKEGLAVIKFAKNKFSKNKDASTENNITLNDVLEIGNRVKDIVENDITPITNDVVELKNEWTDNSNELLEVDSHLQDENSIDDNEISVLPNNELAEEDTFFENSLNNLLNASQNGYLNLDNPEEVLRAFNTLQMVANETIKYVEEQETKRVEINAQRDIAIEKIRVIEKAITTYLEKTFDERSLIFSKQFEAVDAALKNNNTEQLAISLNSINSLAAQSPFKALADLKSVQKQLLETDTEWDI